MKPAVVFHGDGSGDAPFNNSFSWQLFPVRGTRTKAEGIYYLIASLGKFPSRKDEQILFYTSWFQKN